MHVTASSALIEQVKRAVQLEAAGNRSWRTSGTTPPNENDVAGLLQIARAQMQCGHYVDARIATVLAANREPNDLRLRAEVAARLRLYNEGARLLAFVRKSGPIQNLPIPLLLAFANQLSLLNQQSDALALLDEAHQADPDYPPTALARGRVLMFLGEKDAARAELERCVRRAPEIVLAHWSLSNLVQATPGDNRIDALKQALLKAKGHNEQAATISYALHKELDDLQLYEDAETALNNACRANRSVLSYDPEATTRLFSDLASMPAAAVKVTCDAEVTPIFIIGMHRSGTTLLEQMLDGNPQVIGVGELYDFTSAMRYVTDHHCQGVIDQAIVQHAAAPDFDFAEVGRRYLEGVGWRLGGKPFFTDKLPSNFLNAGFICQALPQAKLLHMVRDPIEVCFSNLRELFSNANAYSYDQMELADYYLHYHRLMAHWRDAFPGRILDIHYDRMVREPEAVIREVCDFCGLDFVPEMLDIGNRKRGVATASAVQVREGIQVREVPKWKPYEAYLQPMINRLREGGVLEN